MSWRQGTRGQQVTCTGGHFRLVPGHDGVPVRVVQDIVDDVKVLVDELLRIYVIFICMLAAALGKLNIPGMLHVCRPIMALLRSAMHAATADDRGATCICRFSCGFVGVRVDIFLLDAHRPSELVTKHFRSPQTLS